MSEQEKTLLKEIQGALVKGLVTVFISSLVILLSFYFATIYRMDAIEKEVTRKMDKEPMQTEIRHIKTTLDKIEKKIGS